MTNNEILGKLQEKYPDFKIFEFADLFTDCCDIARASEREAVRQDMIDFAEYVLSLNPTERVTVHAPAGSGAPTGVYVKPTSAILDSWLRSRKPQPPTT